MLGRLSAELALLFEMVPLLQLLPPEIAGNHGSAVAIDAVAEVLAGQANAASLSALKLTIVNEIPFLHT